MTVNSCYFDFDNGNICRWINGTRAASCQFSAFYSNKVNKQHLSVDIEENVFPFLTDVYAVIDKIKRALDKHTWKIYHNISVLYQSGKDK